MKRDFHNMAAPAAGGTVLPPAPPRPPVLTLDVALYEQHLADSGMTDDQKREFLEALWIIIVGFVDLGFGIHPVQQALQANTEEQGGTHPALPALEYHQQPEKIESLSREEE